MNILFLILGIVFGAAAAYFVLKAKLAEKYAKYLSENEVAEKFILREIYEKEKEFLEKQMNENKNETEKLHEQMKIQFENAANKILEEKSKRFVELNEEKIGGILKPLGEKLGEFQKKVEDTHIDESKQNASLLEAIKNISEVNKQMSAEADKLTKALKGDSKIQGNWGELQLEVLLDRLGFVEGIHYEKQMHFKTEDNAHVYPDFVVKLSDKKHCIIDSKVSLTAYEKYFNSENDDEKRDALKKHISSVKSHIQELSAKKYEQLYGINSPDFVFMFVPIESALLLAVQDNPSLVEDAARKNVMLVSTSTLLFALRTVDFIRKVENQNKNVQEIAKIGGDLYDKFAGFIDDMIDVGTKIDSSKKVYESAMKKITNTTSSGKERADTILGKADSLKKLGAITKNEIDSRMLKRLEE